MLFFSSSFKMFLIALYVRILRTLFVSVVFKFFAQSCVLRPQFSGIVSFTVGSAEVSL